MDERRPCGRPFFAKELRVPSDDIRRVLIVGAGTMGQQTGVQCALHGCAVTLYDASAQALAAAPAGCQAVLDHIMAEGRLTPDQAEAARRRLAFSAEAQTAADGIDLLSGSFPDDPRLKGRVPGAFHRWRPPHALFTTNTSTRVPSQFARATGRPPQFAALHFHQPVTKPCADPNDLCPAFAAQATLSSPGQLGHNDPDPPNELRRET